MRASRIAAQAEGGQILASSIVKSLIGSTGDLRFGASRELRLKGISDGQPVHDVEWE